MAGDKSGAAGRWRTQPPPRLANPRHLWQQPRWRDGHGQQWISRQELKTKMQTLKNISLRGRPAILCYSESAKRRQISIHLPHTRWCCVCEEVVYVRWMAEGGVWLAGYYWAQYQSYCGCCCYWSLLVSCSRKTCLTEASTIPQC